MQDSRQWDHHLLSTIFEPLMVHSISSTLTTQSQLQDTLRWLLAISGICTTKAAYTYMASQQQHILPQQGSRNVSPHSHDILLKVWKSKLIPPFLTTFAWRLLRRSLALLKGLLDFLPTFKVLAQYVHLLKLKIIYFFVSTF
jgi:hypothetical protein